MTIVLWLLGILIGYGLIARATTAAAWGRWMSRPYEDYRGTFAAGSLDARKEWREAAIWAGVFWPVFWAYKILALPARLITTAVPEQTED